MMHLPIRHLPVLSVLILLLPVAVSATGLYSGPLPDFEGDRFHRVVDFQTGQPLEPGLPGETFEWASPAVVDWNHDGVFDLIVGYNLREPDMIRMVVYLNQGSVGDPRFTGTPGPDTCFYVETVYPGESGFRIFESLGWHMPYSGHKFMVHNPGIYDFNHDGLFDILVNEQTYDPGQGRGQWFLLNTGSPGAPEFGVSAYLHDDAAAQGLPPGGYRDAFDLFRQLPGNATGSYPCMTLVDWNSDGIPDINYANASTQVLYGALDGAGNWYARDGAWSPASPVGEGEFGHTPHILTADFNGDGVNELLVGDAQGHCQPGCDGFLELFVRDPGTTEVRYIRDTDRMFMLSSPANPDGFPDAGWWHPRPAAIDFDEDGDPDILCGWGGGNGQGQVGTGIYHYRTPGGDEPGSHPIFAESIPVQVSSFTVEWAGERAELRWRSATGGTGFDVFRQRDDEAPRVEIGQATVATDGEYRFQDPQPPGSGARYWLREAAGQEWIGPATLGASGLAGPLRLLPAEPNPFVERTTLRFATVGTGPARLRILDLRGRVVAQLPVPPSVGGSQAVEWDGRDASGGLLARGTYLVELLADGQRQTRKLSISR